MRKYLVDKKEEIRSIEVKERLFDFPLTKDFIVSIVGPRRAGKTYSIFDFIKKNNLKDEDFLFVNFEDDAIKMKSREEVARMVSFHYETYGKYPKFIFLDELQAFENWQSFVYSLFEKKEFNIFITGSSSKLLSKEIATELRGRTISLLVLPFSFKEFLKLKNFDTNIISTKQEDKVNSLLKEFLKEGGFPSILLTGVNKSVFFRNYLDLVVFRDIVERFGIKNPSLVKMLMSSMISSFSKEFSVNKIYNLFKSKGMKVNKSTLYDYASFLEQVMFCFFLKKFGFSEKKSNLSIPKVYLNDVGLVNYSFSSNFEENFGRLMENTVFLELKRKESKGLFDHLFYWKNYQDYEVDFVIKKGLEVKQLIQVCYDLSNPDTKKRELRALAKASEELKCNNLLVITWDYEKIEKFKNKEIKFTPLWKWLLQKQ